MYNSVRMDMIRCILEQERFLLMEKHDEDLIDTFEESTGLSVDNHYRMEELIN